MVESQLPHPRLRDELLRFAAGAKKKQRRSVGSQIKSELVVLLYEAKRRGAYASWGYADLGEFAKHELQLTKETFAKYRRAGENFFAYDRHSYDALLTAVLQGTTRPRLPEVSKLETLKRFESAPGVIDALQRGSSLRIATAHRDIDRFGGATDGEKRILRALDEVVDDINDVRANVGALDVTNMTPDGRDRLVQKLDASSKAFDSFWTEMDRLAVALGRGRTPRG